MNFREKSFDFGAGIEENLVVFYNKSWLTSSYLSLLFYLFISDLLIILGYNFLLGLN